MSWDLRCAWCSWYIVVGARGMRGRDPGAGVEAAELMERHVAALHGRTWREYLDAAAPRVPEPPQ